MLSFFRNPSKRSELIVIDDEETIPVFLPDEIWLHIFSFINYSEFCCVRLVCRRFYNITKEPTISPQPPWSKKAIQRRRFYLFAAALNKKVISLG